MGRGSADKPGSPNLLYGPVIPRRLEPELGVFELVMIVDLVEPKTDPPISYRFDVADAFRSVTVSAIQELGRTNWEAPWLGSWLSEQRKRGDRVIARYLDLADANSEWWKCRLDPDSAIAWCDRRCIDLD